jgi:UDP-glucose 4-epimerase
MKILVTGGAGYIGSITTKLLLQDNQEVIILDNLSRGHKAAVPKGAIFIQSDLANISFLNKIFIEHRIEYVIHFAATSLVEESVKNPNLYFFNNVVNGVNLLKTMIEHNVLKIIFSSSAAVYGRPDTVPIPETAQINPLNPYGRTKQTFENLLEEYDKAYGLKYISLRYFNVAGAYEELGEDHRPETHLIPLILKTALGKQDNFKIFGNDYNTRDGTCIRDYIHVYDVAIAHLLAKATLNQASKIYNLGSENGATVQEVFKTACEVTGTQLSTKVTGRRAGDPPVLIASSQKIKKELGWQPQRTNLKTIIQDAWNWYQDHPQGYPE